MPSTATTTDRSRSEAEPTRERVHVDGTGSHIRLGLVHRVDGRDGVARFEIADPERHHHHVVDEATGEVRPFSDESLEHAIAAVGQRLGMRLTSHEVILRGVRDADAPPRSTM